MALLGRVEGDIRDAGLPPGRKRPVSVLTMMPMTLAPPPTQFLQHEGHEREQRQQRRHGERTRRNRIRCREFPRSGSVGITAVGDHEIAPALIVARCRG